MTNSEFNNEFDILWNNIMSNQAPGLNSYEKSVLLTLAKEELVISLYSGRNELNLSLEQTEELRRYLDTLIKTDSPNRQDKKIPKLSDKSIIYELPDDLLFIIYESVEFSNYTCAANKSAIVVPVTHDDYWRVSNNPFRRHNKRRVLRLNCDGNNVELISQFDISKYIIRYLSKPLPIILEDLDGLTINNKSEKTECDDIDSSLHRAILNRAVQIAQERWAMNLNKQQQ